MTQSGGTKKTSFVVTLYNFQKSGRAIALPIYPSPRSLETGCNVLCACVWLSGRDLRGSRAMIAWLSIPFLKRYILSIPRLFSSGC